MIIIIYIYIVIHHIICFLSVLISSSAPALGAAEVTNEFSIRPYLVEQETIRGIKFTFRPAKSLGCRKWMKWLRKKTTTHHELFVVFFRVELKRNLRLKVRCKNDGYTMIYRCQPDKDAATALYQSVLELYSWLAQKARVLPRPVHTV